MTKHTFHRQTELRDIEQTLFKEGPCFLYVRGRRRVGKSWILKKLSEKHKNVFYFMGSLDAKTSVTLADFATSWGDFSGRKTLTEIKKPLLTWQRLFEEITNHIRTSKKEIVLIFDEIQWIAKEGSGFIGKLKSAWLDWESLGRVKVIVCGSSNKFFSEKTGGEEKILRGLKTHADIFILPLSLKQCVAQKFKKWRLEEATMAYMMTGGVPYYLNQIDEQKSFAHAMNDAFFIKHGIFLEEADEVLNVDFNKKGMRSVKTILSAIGLAGATQITIERKTKISNSTVNEVLGKLQEYGLIQGLTPHNQAPKANQAGTKYIIRDFYLNTYFTLLKPLENKIKTNTKSLLFTSHALKNDQGYYIQGYTGYMYERVVRELLESKSLQEPLFKKLGLRDADYIVSQYWDKEQQVDLIVDHQGDRVSRALEIKWIAESNCQPNQVFKELEEKVYPVTKYYSREDFAVVSELKKNSAPKKPANLITLTDLI